jgi:hypothetical protein
MKLKIASLLFFTCFAFGQAQELTDRLFETYEKYKEPSLIKRRIKHTQLQPLLRNLKTSKEFTVQVVGKSMEGRDLSLVSIGSGDIDVFLWSQMHGNEPTATQAIFDIFNFLASDDFASEKQQILSNLKLHFLPMLNPDGAERFQRRNVLGVDINRDALRLQSPESQTLKRVRDSLDAEFGFNLHDQSTYYNTERTEKPATISYLAPAYNYEKEINASRGNAMKIIVFMNDIIQKYAPGQVGRYDDSFEPRAFGDNIQKWGTSTILIESGGFAKDVEKQEIRKLNYVSILAAVYTIAKGNFRNISIAEYEKIPENDRKLFDFKITNATYEINGKPYILDIGMNRLEVEMENSTDFWYSSRVIDQGDLSTYYGYKTFDASGYTLVPGKVYPKVLNTMNQLEISGTDFMSLLKSGYAYVRLNQIPPKMLLSPLPIHILSKGFDTEEFNLEVGINPTFFLKKRKIIEFAVINGFLIDLKKDLQSQLQQFTAAGKNAMIYR